MQKEPTDDTDEQTNDGTPTDEIELTHQLLTERGDRSMHHPDRVDNKTGGVQLRYEVPDGSGVVYIQMETISVQMYDGDPLDDDTTLIDISWDHLTSLSDGAQHSMPLSNLREFCETYHAEVDQ